MKSVNVQTPSELLQKMGLAPVLVSALLTEQFFIPEYQRGYRWSSREVKDLLDDLATFWECSSDEHNNKFYCLQPIVVRMRPEGDWEVIDGQQRLTTIYLILKFLRSMSQDSAKQLYSLRYATRKDSETFLETLNQNLHIPPSGDNIDYYYISSAYQTIENWFKERNDYVDRFSQLLTSEVGTGKNAKFIWYQLPATEKPIDVFVRLNVGRIPLTSAELIRALFLRAGNFDPNGSLPKRLGAERESIGGEESIGQLQIAEDWDYIEKELQDDHFWYFLYSGDKTFATRIEYLFWLIASEKPASDISDDDPLYTFIAYQRLFEESAVGVNAKWRDVKKRFLNLEGWYNDRTFYHLVGYLVSAGEPMLHIMREAANKTKSTFRQFLRGRIFERLCGEPLNNLSGAPSGALSNFLVDLDYPCDKRKISDVLLLFNIATLLQNRASFFFPFSSFKKEPHWHIEHIRSVKSGKPERISEQKQWLENVLEYWTDESERKKQRLDACDEPDLCTKIISVVDAPRFDQKTFDSLYDEILKRFKEADFSETDNSLANLALLDASTNTSYKNAVFPIKRRRILDLDRSGTFVPLCTRTVFLKGYSHKIRNMMFWDLGQDGRDYHEAILKTLTEFFIPNEKAPA